MIGRSRGGGGELRALLGGAVTDTCTVHKTLWKWGLYVLNDKVHKQNSIKLETCILRKCKYPTLQMLKIKALLNSER